MKLLVWLLLGVLVYFAVRKNLRAASDKKQPDQAAANDWADASSTYSANKKESEPMLNCGHCQVYFPASEAVVRGSHNFCCLEHAELAINKETD